MFSHDPFTVVIGDESHYFRNRSVDRGEPFNVRERLGKKGNVNRDKIKAARKQKRKNKK
tara:strand:+ start:149 stop:325 length:177 start_codon:yes stop_codon:yes gene_type:complete